MELFLHSELSRIAIQQGLENAYLVWCAIRCDVNENETSSHYTKSDIKSLISDYGLEFSDRNLTRIFKQGESIFWGTDYTRLYIRSIERVIKTLAKLDTANRVIRDIITVSVTIKSSKPNALRAELYFAWFARTDETTISRATLQELFNLSPVRQRALERILKGRLCKKTNYVHVDKQAYEQTAKRADFAPLPAHAEQYTQEYYSANRVSYRDVLFYQMPNTYCVGRDSGVSPEITPNTAQNAVRTLLGRTSCSNTSKRQYYRNCEHFEQYGQDLESFWRAYYQGSKRVWKYAKYA